MAAIGNETAHFTPLVAPCAATDELATDERRLHAAPRW
jgi:hypothetical protein